MIITLLIVEHILQNIPEVGIIST